MRQIPGSELIRPVAPAPDSDQEAMSGAHPAWCQFDAPGALGGIEHSSRLLPWSPTYLSEVAVIGWLRHACYDDGSEETPAVALHIDNPEHPGEIALTGEDLASLAEHLLSLRRALVG